MCLVGKIKTTLLPVIASVSRMFTLFRYCTLFKSDAYTDRLIQTAAWPLMLINLPGCSFYETICICNACRQLSRKKQSGVSSSFFLPLSGNISFTVSWYRSDKAAKFKLVIMFLSISTVYLVRLTKLPLIHAQLLVSQNIPFRLLI